MSFQMNLTKLFQRLSNNVSNQSLVILSALTLASVAIWYGAHAITPERKIYLISFLFLLWALKILLIDMDSPNPSHYNGIKTQEKLKELQNRFLGALQFLNKTTAQKNHQSVRLNQLPWMLVIGTESAGKTTLLANANVNFILQRQFQAPDTNAPKPSDHCDWWVTRDITLIDVPGKYITAPDDASLRKTLAYPLLWRFFLRLIKKYRGKEGIQGIVITLPLPETLKQQDIKQYHLELRQLLNRLDDLQKIFTKPLPCYLVVTKCDLLPGFSQFFAESANEEITQAWGVSSTTTHDSFIEQFDLLIKKLNQQLLWRLHQERNPMNRPPIKDFPLQVERLKEVIADFIKKLTATTRSLSLQGVYLTSALQPEPTPESVTIDDTPNQRDRAVALFKEPAAASRTHFVKQLITHALTSSPSTTATHPRSLRFGNKVAILISILTVSCIALLLGRDFQQGVKQSYDVQKTLTNYQLTIEQIHNPEDRLQRTLQLVTTLQPYSKTTYFKWDVRHLLTFYSQKAKEKTTLAYNDVLQTIFIPEVTRYLADYLKNPVNKTSDSIYTVLESYLMLGDSAHFNVNTVSSTLLQILPKSFSEKDFENIENHIQLALTTLKNPPVLDDTLIAETRKYLTALPGDQIGYIILKNSQRNNTETTIQVGTDSETSPVLISRTVTNQVPTMFTALAFPNIVNNETNAAALESMNGNWILGNTDKATNNTALINALKQQLDAIYINNYIDVWESLLSNIHLAEPKDLSQTDAMIIHLTSNDSPLLQLIQTLRTNTYFEPIISSSSKLQSLGALLNKNDNNATTLASIFTSLSNLHQYLQQILSSPNEKRIAFEYVTSELRKSNANDPLMQLRAVAQMAPEPIKSWLEQIANNTWRFLLRDAIKYIDISWQTQVIKPYESDIAHRYPFSLSANTEVDVNKFTQFFSNSGALMSYYNNVLSPFVDTTGVNWQWRQVNNEKIPLSSDVLKSLQQAMHINKTFFPNGDNTFYVQYSTQPYKITHSKLVMNDKFLVDRKNGTKNSHLILLNLAQFHLPEKIIS